MLPKNWNKNGEKSAEQKVAPPPPPKTLPEVSATTARLLKDEEDRLKLLNKGGSLDGSSKRGKKELSKAEKLMLEAKKAKEDVA